MPSRLKKRLRVDNLWDGLCALCDQGIGSLLRPRQRALRREPMFPRARLQVEALEDRSLLTVVSLTGGPYSVNENAWSAPVTVSLDAASSSTVSVQLATSDGTATAMSDYFGVSQTVWFFPGTTSQTVNVSITSDSADEADETINLTLSNPSGAALGTSQSAITIVDDDAPPAVQFSQASASVMENSLMNPVQFTVTLSAASGRTVAVDYASSNGTAAAGSDYTAVGGTLTFSPGQTSKTISVSITNDSTDENDETATLTLSNPSNASLGTNSSSTLTIQDDDDAPSVAFSSASFSANENAAGGTASITVSLSAVSGKDVTVHYATSNGTATASSDYTAASGDVTITAGNPTATFSVALLDDSVYEGNETVSLTLSSPTNASLGSQTTATLTILENDSPPAVYFYLTDYYVGESDGTAVIGVELAGNTTQTATVQYATAAYSATAGSDYTHTSGTLTFNAGVTWQTFSVPIATDSLDEIDEQLILSLLNPNHAILGNPYAAYLNITDDDAPPAVRFKDAPYTVAENVIGGQKTIAVELTAPSGKTVTADYATSNGSATAPGDYTSTSNTLTFAPGDTEKNFQVTIANDSLNEDGENLNLTLSNENNATLGNPSGTTLTITDDDPLPLVRFSASTFTEDEDVASGFVTITVELSAPSGRSVSVAWATSNGSAIAGSDYTAASSTLTFAPGQTSKTFDVTLINDSSDEDDETVSLTLSSPSNASLGTPFSATLTIEDDDAPPGVSFSGAPFVEDEDVSSGLAAIVVALAAASGKTVTVNCAASNGTATGSDYSAANGTLTFLPSETSKTFSVFLVNDSMDEYDETVQLTLSSPSNATLASPYTTTLTIVDDDPLPTVQFSGSTFSAMEDVSGGNAEVIVTLSAQSGKTVTVQYATSNGTATAPADYTAASGTLTFAAGEISKTILVPVVDDVLVEANETLTLTLTSPSEATLGSPASATLTILNDDHPPLAADDVYTSGSPGKNITAAAGLLANDSDPDQDTLTASLVTGTGHGPYHGTVTVYADGSFTYSPGLTFTGRDSFDYTVSDGGQSDEGHVTLYWVDTTWPSLGGDPAKLLRVPVGEAEADLNNGGLRLAQELDFDLSPGTTVGGSPALVYNSAAVEERPYFKVQFNSDANPGSNPPAPPTSIQVRLIWDGVLQTTTTFQTTGHEAGDSYLLAVQGWPVSESGIYDWTIEVQPFYDSTYAPTLVLTGQSDVKLVEDDSPYGDGWGIRGIDRLAEVDNGICWVAGDGEQRYFQANGSSTFYSPPGDYGQLTQAVSGGLTTYTYIAKDQTEWTFNDAGLLTAVTDTHGLARTYQYDAGGRLIQVNSPDGGVTTLDYVTAPSPYGYVTLSEIEEPGGRVLTFSHDVGIYPNNIPTVTLTSLHDADGNQRAFTYDGSHRLTRDQWAPLDATFSYDAHGFLSGISRGLGVNYAVLPLIAEGFQTNPAAGIDVKNLAVLTDANGVETQWRMDWVHSSVLQIIDDGNSGTSNPQRTWTWDSAGKVRSHTDPLGEITCWDYDGSGDLVEIGRPDGSFVLYEYDPVFHHVTRETQSVSSGVSAVTVRTYNGPGDLQSETTAYGTAQAATTDYTWSNGLLQTSEDPLGNVTEFYYDSHRRLTGLDIHDGAIQDPVIFAEDYGYDSHGNPFDTTNVMGITETTYSAANRLLSEEVYQPNGTTLVRSNTLDYLPAGHVNYTEDGDYNCTETDYDVVGRPTQERAYDGQGGLDWKRTLAYDGVNNLTRVTAGDNSYIDYVWDAWANLVGENAHNANGDTVETHSFVHDLNGDLIESIDGDDYYVLYTRDELGRLLTETAYDDDDVAAGFTGYTYNKAGDLVDTRDWYGNHTAFGYTLTGLLASEDVYSSGNVLLSETDYYRNANGYLTSIVDGEDNTTAFTLDALGRALLTQVFDPLLNLVSKSETHFNTAGFVDWIKDGLGNTTSYVLNALGEATHWEVRTPAPANVLVTQGSAGFTPSGALDWTTDGLNNLLDYSHDGTGQVTKVQLLSPANVLVSETTSQFNQAGRLEWIKDPNGNKTSFVFNGANHLTHTDTRTSTGALVTESDEHWTVGGFQDWTEDGEDNRTVVERNGAGQIIWEKVFDRFGVLVSQQFAGYDMRGLRTSLTDVNGNTTFTVYDGADRPVHEFMLDINSDLIWEASYGWNMANQLVSETDGNGNVKAFQRDANGRAVGVQVRNANNVVVANDQFGFDLAGLLDWQQDGGGNRIVFARNALGQVTRQELRSPSNALVGSSESSFDQAGRKEWDKDGNGNKRVYTRDAAGNVTGEQLQDANGNPHSSASASYDPGGRIVSETDANGNTRLYQYNGANQLVHQETRSPSSVLVSQKDSTYDGAGRLLTETDGEGNVTSYQYDAGGRIILQEVRDANAVLASKREFHYDASGEMDWEKDGNGNKTLYTRDGKGRVRLQEIRNASNVVIWKAEFHYDAAGNLDWQKDGNGNKTTYTRDGKGRVTHQEVRTPSNVLVSKAESHYDASGFLDWEKHGNGNKTVYVRDAAGRVKRQEQRDANNVLLSAEDFVYDQNGWLVSWTDANGNETVYIYDAAGQLLHEELLDPNSVLVTEADYDYDGVGNLIAQTDANGNVISYQYDADGHVLYMAIHDAGNVLVTEEDYDYDLAGYLVSQTDGEGNVTSYVVDAEGRVLHQEIEDANSILVIEADFDYDLAGNLVSQTDGEGNVTSYDYDAALQLVHTEIRDASNVLAWEMDYGYDLAGNQTSQTGANGNVTLSDYDAVDHVIGREIRDASNVLVREGFSGYDLAGNLVSQTDGVGNVTTYDYDGAQRVIHQEIHDASNALVWEMDFAYDDVGNLIAQTDANGNVTLSDFDALGNVIHQETQNPSSIVVAQWDADYDEAGLLVAQTDGNGNVTSFDYDGAGQVVRKEIHDASNVLVFEEEFAYDLAGLLVLQTDANGNTTIYDYDGAGQLVHQEVRDASNVLVIQSDADYDAASRLIAQTDGNGNVTSFDYDGEGQVVRKEIHDASNVLVFEEEFEYDEAGYLIARTDANGNVTSFVYDAAGRAIHQDIKDASNVLVTESDSDFDLAGNLVSQTDGEGNVTSYVYDGALQLIHAEIRGASNVLAWEMDYGYDLAGNQTSQTDANGNVTSYEFDALGNAVHIEVRDAGNSLDGEAFSAFDLAGNLVTETDGEGNVTLYDYDGALRVIHQEIRDASNVLAWEMGFAYDNAGNLIEQTEGNGNVTLFDYDGARHLIHQETQDASNNVVAQSDAEYDETGLLVAQTDGNGNVASIDYDGAARVIHQEIRDASNTLVWQIDAAFDAAGNLTSQTDGTGYATTFFYDGAGQLVLREVRDAINSLIARIEFAFDLASHLIAQIDGTGHETHYGYDGAGRKTAETQAYGTSQAATRQFQFDNAGNLVTVIDPVNNYTTFAYDAAGNKTAMTDPLNNTATYDYDLAGRMSSATDRNGLRRDFVHDGAGHLTSEKWYAANGTTLVETLTWTYDLAGNMLTAGNSAGDYVFTYDAANRVIHADEPFGVELDFTYDLAGNRTLVEDSFGGSVASTYDGANQLVSRLFAQTNQPTLRIDIDYDLAGRIDLQTRFSDAAGITVIATSEFYYDVAGRLIDLTHWDATPAVLAFYSFYYDVAGQITLKDDHGSTTNYAYDNLKQLTDDGVHTYSFDTNGNRTMSGYVTGEANQVLSDGTWAYTYDDEGNRIAKTIPGTGEAWTYEFDGRNQLIEVEHKVSTNAPVDLRVELLYDAFGNMLQKNVDADGDGGGNPVATKYALDGWKTGPQKSFVGNENWDVWANLDAANNLTTRYLRGDAIDELFARVGSSGDACWTLTDYQGSVRDVLEQSSGDVKDTTAFDGFGNITAETNAAYRGDYGWTGRVWIAEIGLQYNRARFYDAAVGRWLNPDPSGFDAGDGNLYRNVGNNPVNATDPSGLMYWSIIQFIEQQGKQFPQGSHAMGGQGQMPGMFVGGNGSLGGNPSGLNYGSGRERFGGGGSSLAAANQSSGYGGFGGGPGVNFRPAPEPPKWKDNSEKEVRRLLTESDPEVAKFMENVYLKRQSGWDSPSRDELTHEVRDSAVTKGKRSWLLYSVKTPVDDVVQLIRKKVREGNWKNGFEIQTGKRQAPEPENILTPASGITVGDAMAREMFEAKLRRAKMRAAGVSEVEIILDSIFMRGGWLDHTTGAGAGFVGVGSRGSSGPKLGSGAKPANSAGKQAPSRGTSPVQAPEPMKQPQGPAKIVESAKETKQPRERLSVPAQTRPQGGRPGGGCFVAGTPVVVTEDEQEELDACVWDPRWVAAAIGVTSVGTVGWVVGRKRGRRRRSIFLRESDRRPIRQI